MLKRFVGPPGYGSFVLDTDEIKTIVQGKYNNPDKQFSSLQCHKLITTHGNYLVELNRYSMFDWQDVK